MKKVFIYLVLFVFVFFIIPALLTKRTMTTISDASNDLQEQNEIEENNYIYEKYGVVNLLHKTTGNIEQVNIDEYLYNVVSAEMPADFEYEALKAQAIVARTYTIYKILNKKHDNADICDDSTCCQAWISKDDRLARWEENLRESNWQKICNAVNSTKGKIITYDNTPINAFFHSNSGGTTETPVNVWGGTGYPYLQSVQTSGEDAYSQYLSEVILTHDELLNKLKTKYSDITIDFSNEDEIKIIDYTEGNRVKTNFEIIKEGDNIKFSVKGYGHGVGMSQTGADAMAKSGSTAEDIINHFYTGIEIKDINSL